MHDGSMHEAVLTQDADFDYYGSNQHLKQGKFVTDKYLNIQIPNNLAVNTLKPKHYENTAIFQGCKNGNFQMKKCHIFLIFAQNIDCGYTLEPPQLGGSNEYPQSMF